MEHEVFVPVTAGPLRRALADPLRVARAVPGLQQDAGEAPVSGRLKVRVGGSSITYRGTLRVVRQDDGSYVLEGDAAEARGSGTVKVALTLRLTAADGGTTLVFDGRVTGDGRFADLDPGVAATAGRRLLNRFAEGVAGGGGASGAPENVDPSAPSVRADEDVTSDGAERDAQEDAAGSATSDRAEADVATSSGTDEGDTWDDARGDAAQDARGDAGQDTEHDAGQDTGDDMVELPVVEAGGPVFDVDNQPPAEAAHARRTMIGRSAEEVDHAPPRGRYAPVPAPATVSASAALRWAAPAAALVLASAIVIGRALRRRR